MRLVTILIYLHGVLGPLETLRRAIEEERKGKKRKGFHRLSAIQHTNLVKYARTKQNSMQSSMRSRVGLNLRTNLLLEGFGMFQIGTIFKD